MLLSRKNSKKLSWLLCLSMAVSPCLTVTPVQAGGFRNPFYKQTSMEKLADKIDDLEEHVEKYGTVVAKTPDVWGEARLTKYRQQIEEELGKRLVLFDETINASISRSDKAFLANALTLQAAATGTAPDPSGATALIQDNTKNITVDVFKDDTNRTVNIFPSSGGVSKTQIQGISLEPTTGLDQLSRYLKHLNQLRRVNDGDDTADAPGYALHLVRIPVSILPGKKTREGYGAEITLTAEPYLGDDLLSNTFRSLAINDVVDQVTFPLTKYLEGENAKNIEEILTKLAEAQEKLSNDTGIPLEEIKEILSTELSNFVGDRFNMQTQKYGAYDEKLAIQNRKNFRSLPVDKSEAKKDIKEIEKIRKELEAQYVKELHKYKTQVSSSHRSLKPFPASQLFDIYGEVLTSKVAKEAEPLKETENASDKVLLLDVQAWLTEELNAAYNFLNTYNHGSLWSHANSALNNHVKSKNNVEIESARNNFITELPAGNQETHTAGLAWALIVEAALLDQRLKEDIQDVATSKNCNCLPRHQQGMPYSFTPNHHDDPNVQSVFKGYVKCRWPVHVFAIDPVTQDQNVADSFSQRRELQLAMSIAFTQGQMNASNFTRFARRLDLDMDSISLNRTTVGFSHGDDTFGWRFYPRVQSPEVESNLSVAFGDLLIGGPSRDKLLSQRRLEPGKRECVALVVMPSFVPYTIFDMRSNWFKLTNPEKKELTLSDTVEISEEIKSLDRLMVCCQEEIGKYRQGEVHRLKRAVKQLERKLPLQTSYVPMPYETSAGGFELLAKSTSALGPQLDGFYGRPGFKEAIANNAETASTGDSAASSNTTPEDSADVEIFLVGDNFSVHETQVIAGNREAKYELLSRRIMKVKIPANAQPNGDHIDIHVATPYGISNHLEIPFIKSTTKEEATAEAAKKVVAEALAVHGESYHPTNFEISQSNSDLGATVTFTNTLISGIQFNNPDEHLTIAIQDKNYNKVFASTELELAFKVKVTGKNRSAAGELTDDEETVSAGTWPVHRINPNDTTPQYRIKLIDLSAKLLEGLESVAFTGSVESIELVGYVRNKADQLPITKVKSPVKISVTHNPIGTP